MVSRIPWTYAQFLKNMSRNNATFGTKLANYKVLLWFHCKIEIFTRPLNRLLVNYKNLVSRIPWTYAQFLKNMSRKIVTFYKVWFWFWCKMKLFTRPPKWWLVYYKYLVSRITQTYAQFLKNMSWKIVTIWTILPFLRDWFLFQYKIELSTGTPRVMAGII